MQNIQLILLVAGGFVFLGVAFFAIKKRFSTSKISEEETFDEVSDEEAPHLSSSDDEGEACAPVIQEEVISDKNNDSNAHSEHNDFIMISLHAQPGRVFTDYHFLQILGAVGLVYGEHKIFHYDVKTDIGVQRLFSVAQLNNPGTFDLDHVESINCKGLLLFIDFRQCRKQVLALDCMLETAYQLAEDLDAIMFEAYDTAWQDDTPRALSKRLEQYHKIGLRDEFN